MRKFVQELVHSIQQLSPDEQRELLTRLPELLHVTNGDFPLLKLAESAFAFWDNPDDAVYDGL